MFDDQPTSPQGQTPVNLPLGEPEDVFAQTEPASPSAPPPLASPSALDAGILKPKENPQAYGAPTPPFSPSRMAPPAPAEVVMSPTAPLPLKEPTLSRGILVAIIIIVGLVLVGGAFWWVYRYMNVPEVEETVSDSTPSDISGNESETPTLPPVTETSSGSDESALPAEDTSSSQPIDETLLFGEATDTDNDGLDDRRETSLQTNPEKADTDNDELSDGDEVIIWGTDPLNPDSDGDSYLDGREIKAGFSPKGPGKLFEVQTTPTDSTTTAS